VTAITFNFDTQSLIKARPLQLKLGQGKFQFPNTGLYTPIRKFKQAYCASYNGFYQFKMFNLLHVAAVKMLTGKLSRGDFQTALFASGGLYLALNQLHSSLAIEKTFGDFTSGFSHQFGVALACMVLSEAYRVPWDKMSPIPVKGKKSLDYEIGLPDECWLKLEAKGVSGGSLSSARSSIFKKKQTTLASSQNNNTAMVGVIVQASRDLRKNGVIELIDPFFAPNLEARQPENQLAGRYLHYTAIARLAGLENVADEFKDRVERLISSHMRNPRTPRRYETDNIASINGRTVVGVQWRLGNGFNSGQQSYLNQEEVWFYQGMDLSILDQVLQNELPDTASFHYPQDGDRDARNRLSDSSEDAIHSFLPDGSYFGMGASRVAGLVPISRYELSDPPFIGRLR